MNLWAVTRDNAYTSHFASSAWSNTPIGSAGAAISSEHVYRNPNDGYVFVSGSHDNKASLQRSTDNGSSWTEVFAPSSSGSTFMGTVAHPTASGQIYAFGGYSDQGSWKNFVSSADHGSSWQAAGSAVGGGTSTINDMVSLTVSGATWMFAALSSGDIYRSQDAGVSWGSVLNLGGSTSAAGIAVNPAWSSVVYAAGSNGVWRSASSGGSGTWNHKRSNDNVHRIIMHPSYSTTSNHVWIIGGGGNAVYASGDGGTGWADMTGTLPTPVLDLRADQSDGRFIYAGTAQGVYKIDPAPDAPVNLTTMTSTHPKFEWNPPEENDLKTGGRYDVWRFYQYCSWNGSKWVCDGAHYNEAHLAYTDNTWYEDTQESVLGGDCSHLYLQKRAFYYVKSIDIGENVSPSSSTIWFLVSCFNDNPEKAVVRENPMEAIPREFSLMDNYPNPFNPVTEITYALPEDGFVTITLYDLLGREVAVLVNETQQAGYKSIRVDCSSFPSGMYLYRMAAGRFSSVKKMVVAK